MVQKRRKVAAENQVALPGLVIDEISQQRKKVRCPLDFIDHDQPGQTFERQLRLIEQGQIAGILQIEEMRGVEGACQGRFSALPRPDNRHHRKRFHQTLQLFRSSVRSITTESKRIALKSQTESRNFQL